ncbi:MAG: hypothetical protein LAP40_16935 [Acidobacteriia bacterium]|nr:hypothetical protein [Terriglobia bacterium]
MSFPSDSESGTARNLTRLTQLLLKARYRTSVGDSNAANKTPLIIQGASGQTANLLEVYDSSKNLLYAVDPSGNVVKSGVSKVTAYRKQVALTAAQIISLHSAPVALVAAPAAGIALFCRSLLFQLIYGAAQFANGGAVTPVYHGATTSLLAGTIPQATIQAAANSTTSAGAETSGLALTSATGIDLYAAGADFITGDSTAIVTIEYDAITLG